MKRKKTRRPIERLSWALSKRPASVQLRLANGRLLLAGDAGASVCPHVIAGILLTKAATQDFFRDLARAVGYEIPSRRSLPPTRRVKGPSVDVLGGTEVVRIHGHFHKRGGANCHGIVQAEISRRKALRVFEAMADPLGWELYEHEVWA